MLVGQRIGPFEIERELGSGAMGTVYRAKFFKDDKVVPIALKVVALGLLGNEGAMARFDREANILKQLRHPHIVRLYATGHYRKTPFIAMEYVDGEALDRVIARRGRMSWEEVVTMGKQLCQALQYAHEKGIIHRDLKPSNLMISRAGVVKLTDFGIAKDMDLTALTGMNSTIGTAAYMSPEQCKGDRNLTGKSDLYSLGVVFFELLTGKKPFHAETTVDMFMKHVGEEPPRIGKLIQDLPPKLEALILQLLAKDKDDRPTDGAWVARLLGEIEADVFDRKSAGLEAASTRKVDQLRRPGTGTFDQEDRDAARALRGKKKRKKKTVPLLQRKWVKAAGIVAVLLAIAGFVTVMLLPPSAATMLAKIEQADDPDKKLEAAKNYLEVHGDTPGDTTDKAAAVFRDETVRLREKQLENRFGTGWEDKPEERDDREAYRTAMAAIRGEKAGDLGQARNLWEQVKGRFPDAAALPFALDDETLHKARWGWVADERVRDIDAARDLGRRLEAAIADNRRFERPMPINASNPESLAMKAIRLEQFPDPAEAVKAWASVVDMTKDQPDQRALFLLAHERRAAGQKAAAGSTGNQFDGVKAKLAEVEKGMAAATADPTPAKWQAVRIPAREIAELYADETGAIAVAVARAKQVLEEATGK